MAGDDALIEIWTDGSCQGNPGPGGWGVLLLDGGTRRELRGGLPATTNNQMELRAVIEALRAAPPDRPLRINLDSSYVQQGITVWLPSWKRRGWRLKGGGAVKNQDYWRALERETERFRRVEWRWLKGHAGDPGNERADQLAREGQALVAAGRLPPDRPPLAGAGDPPGPAQGILL